MSRSLPPVLIVGAAFGAAMLVLQVANGGRLAADTTVAAYNIFVSNQVDRIGAGESSKFTVSVADARGKWLDSTTNPSPLATTTPEGATFRTSFEPDPNSSSNWIMTVTCLSQNITATSMYPAGTTDIELTYPANPASVPPVKVPVGTTKYVLSVTPAIAPTILGGGIVNIIAEVVDPSAPKLVKGVTVTGRLTVLVGGGGFFASANARLQPGNAVTTARGTALFWLRAETAQAANIANIKQWRYVLTFTIGNGKDPGCQQSVIGIIKERG